MKWRNQLLALFCLLAFAGLGVLYFQHWVIQKPFGIILFIGEGLTSNRVATTRLYVNGADTRLTLDSLTHLALLTNYSRDFAVPDQAAAASAIATGVKVNNRALSIGADGKPLATLMELARGQGRATGLVTNAQLTDATCAAFYAHATDANDPDNLARDFVEGGKIDIAIGGGFGHFLPASKNGQRTDGRDLILELRGNGYDVVWTKGELEAIPAWKRPKLFGAVTTAELVYAKQVPPENEQPSLSDMVRRAVELLQYNTGGYLLVIDAGLMRKAAQANNAEMTLSETAELDRAVGVARHYAGKRSAIIVCGDVAMGGLSLNGFPFRKDSGLALLGLNSAGEPWITWATGPNGLKSYGAAKLLHKNDDLSAESSQPEYLEPGTVYTRAALNNADDVIAYGSGPGTDNLRGSLDSTTIFKIVRDAL